MELMIDSPYACCKVAEGVRKITFINIHLDSDEENANKTARSDQPTSAHVVPVSSSNFTDIPLDT